MRAEDASLALGVPPGSWISFLKSQLTPTVVFNDLVPTCTYNQCAGEGGFN